MADFEENGEDHHRESPPQRHSSRGSRHHERDSHEPRSHQRDHERERSRRHGDDRDRSERSDRESDYRRYKSHERERGRDRDRHAYDDRGRDRERRHRHRSRSRGRSKERSTSPSASESRRSSKKQSGFDMAPPAAPVSVATLPGQLATLPQAVFTPGLFPFAGAQFGGFPAVTMQSMTQQATRHARRVYVGGLPPLANEQTIAIFFSQVMAAIGGNTAGPGDAVVNVYINHEKKFAFVEMRTVEEASNAMALDGIIFEGVSVRVRRPTDYNPSVAGTLGPSQPSPHLNLAAVGLTPGSVIHHITIELVSDQ